MTYENFTVYPLEIQGINEASNEKITAIENYVIEQLNYSGSTDDLSEILPYLVYFHFIEDLYSNSAVKTGETTTIRDESTPNTLKVIRAWNIAAEKLSALIADNGETCTTNYLSPREIL